MEQKTLTDDCREVVEAAREMLKVYGGSWPNWEQCLELATTLHLGRPAKKLAEKMLRDANRRKFFLMPDASQAPAPEVTFPDDWKAAVLEERGDA